MTVLATEQIAALVAEFKALNGPLDLGPFEPLSHIYCTECYVEQSLWCIEGDTYCFEHFSNHLSRLIVEARKAHAERQQLIADAKALAERARAEGLSVVELTPDQVDWDTTASCRECCHEKYAYNVEGRRYCLNRTITILREVLA
ncbi:MAG TPA: hypothetical protein VJM32_06060 [Candidatus Saccharimonadales bacterium]|nr:hypothetical protein [Candidatus Saccharimonadales bacterium]